MIPAGTLIIIPAFNEAVNLPRTLQNLRAALPTGYDLAIIDDGSDDETGTVAASQGAFCIRLPIHLGYGGALQTGYKFAIGKGYAFLVQMDADGQHDAVEVPKLIAPLKAGEADCVVGNRFHLASQYKSPFLRQVGRIFFSRVISFFAGIRPNDPTSGFRGFNRKALGLLTRDHFPVDFPDADVFIMMHFAGIRMREVDVLMHSSLSDKSMHSGFFHPFKYVAKMLLATFMIFIRHIGGLNFWKSE